MHAAAGSAYTDTYQVRWMVPVVSENDHFVRNHKCHFDSIFTLKRSLHFRTYWYAQQYFIFFRDHQERARSFFFGIERYRTQEPKSTQENHKKINGFFSLRAHAIFRTHKLPPLPPPRFTFTTYEYVLLLCPIPGPDGPCISWLRQDARHGGGGLKTLDSMTG